MSRGWKIGLGLFAAVVAVNVALAAVERLAGGTPGGPRSSSYATAAGGLAAYAELLSRHGHEIVRIRRPAAAARLDPSTTVVLLDAPFVSPKDQRALGEFVDSGGRLVAGGDSPSWVKDFFEDPPRWSSTGVSGGRVLAREPELRNVRTVAAAGEGSWIDTGEGFPLYGNGARSLLALAQIGRGRLLLIADASPLQNRLLAASDNAALALALAGAPRRVVFLESYHGYGRASGLRALPAQWWAAILLAVCAALVYMLARGRRLGPPEAEARELPPPRREYVESLAAILAKTGKPDEALEPVRARVHARDRLRDDEAVLALGRALVELERGPGRSGR